MLEEVSLLSPYTLGKSLEVGLVSSEIQEFNEELGVPSGVDKMPTRPLILRFPDLDSHGFGEHLLGEFVFSLTSSCRISTGIVDDMSNARYDPMVPA